MGWELKQFLRKLYSQGLPQTQVLVYQKRVLADDQPLIAYFGETRYVQVQLSHWIHLRVRYLPPCDQWSEVRTPVVDHSDASVLLRGVCDQPAGMRAATSWRTMAPSSIGMVVRP